MTILFLGIIIGFLLGIITKPLYDLNKEWRASRRKFFCDGCKTKTRLKGGYSPVSVDLESNSGVVPLNLLFCRKCLPSA